MSTKIALYVVGSLGGLLFGYDTGIIAGALLYISHDLALDPLSKGLVVSATLVGAMIGGGACGPITDWLGRRKLVLAAALVFAVGAIGAGLAPSALALILFRFILGVAVGMASVVVPLYLSEMSPTEVRGTITSLNQFMIIFGIFIANLVSYALAEAEAWRWMLGLAVIPSVAMLLGMLFMPETPRWLVKRGREAEARSVLLRTRSYLSVEQEFANIKDIDRTETNKKGLAELRASWVKPLLIIGIGLAVGQQITGINTIIYYIPTTLASTGLSNTEAVLANVGVGALNVVAIGIVVVFRLVDRLGRKPLLLWGSVGMTLSMAVLGVGSILHFTPNTTAWVVVVGSVAFGMTFNLTWGPVLWVMLSEIYPLKVRGMAMGMTVVLHWGANATVSLTFPMLLTSVGAGGTFIGYALVGAAVLLFVYLLVPETKGRSLEEIEIDARRSTVRA
jgi:sugar porter (SP) family MFS transporter